MRLQGKVAVVTGSSRGIGRAIAVRFAREGADVVVNYVRGADEARQACAEVESAGRRSLLVQADLGSAADARRLIDEGVRHFGTLDVLVNNAGIEKQAPFTDVT